MMINNIIMEGGDVRLKRGTKIKMHIVYPKLNAFTPLTNGQLLDSTISQSFHAMPKHIPHLSGAACVAPTRKRRQWKKRA